MLLENGRRLTQRGTDNYLVDEERMIPSPSLHREGVELGSALEGIHFPPLWPLSRRIMGFTGVNWPHIVNLRAGGQTHCSCSDFFVSRIRLCHVRTEKLEITESDHYTLKMIGLGTGTTVETLPVILTLLSSEQSYFHLLQRHHNTMCGCFF